jgi:septum formation protein
MRHFTDAFLDDYIPAEGAEILRSVGAYRLEGRGAQLFEQIEGDYFAILGLPLLELLDFLRTKGMVLS